jgi:hypothetical protein
MERSKDSVELINAYIRCDCTAELLHLQYDSQDDLIYLSIYEMGSNKNHKMGLWDRLRFAFRVLFTGTPYGDQLVLKDEQLNQIYEFREKVINHKIAEFRKDPAKQLLFG